METRDTTFHLPCGECTITLEDIALQLDLPMDGPIITGSTIVLDKEDLCEFEWMPYANPDIIECVPLEFLAIQSMWDVNVPLIVYAMVEIHESDRVMRQFGWRQKILPPPRDMEALHKLDLRGKADEN
ncbi:hypothetical protein J1N35_040720 [Gossypium stocksii]|uniref:Aminotransferase-like plant mobile domain-containing protein n=1 Tax=Gossypium stocksii TaxID=47602 RepID=A0A9D3UEH9_9ROSI|nr:hypothetical protein J1N35_040720 [Gossypium stocksii]